MLSGFQKLKLVTKTSTQNFQNHLGLPLDESNFYKISDKYICVQLIKPIHQYTSTGVINIRNSNLINYSKKIRLFTRATLC